MTRTNLNRSIRTTAIRLIAAAALFGGATAASAAIAVKTDYTITGDDFDGTFSLMESGGAYTLSAFSATYGEYQYDLSNTGLEQAGIYLLIGGKLNGVNRVVANTNDFNTGYFALSGGQQILRSASVATLKTGSGSLMLTISPVAAVAAGVPEPATWAMMLGGFGATGFAMRRRRTAAARVSFG